LFSWEHRPTLLRLIERAEAGEYDVLIVARFDRLARDCATLVVLERLLERHGVEVVSAAEDNGDGPVAEYLRGNLALVAQLERALIRQRLELGKSKGRRLGRRVEGYAPYGYVLAGQGRLAPDHERAPIARRIFELAKEGNGPARIAWHLNDDGVPSPRGRTWNRQTVTNILRNPVYRGELHGVKQAQPALVSTRLWNAANKQ
jgi:site-specific DNA recombinase